MPGRSPLLKFIFYILALICCEALLAHPPWGISVDAQGNIYFADIFHNGRGSVWKLNSDEKLELLLSDFHAHNVSLDASGNLITGHGEGTHTMVRVNRDGGLDTLHHSTDHKAFFGGNCTYSQAGEILFGMEKHLWRIGTNGEREKLSDHLFEWNQVIYADALGYYYGTEIGEGNGRVVRIDQSGNATIIASNLISKVDRPFDKHFDVLLGMTRAPNGNIYVAETAGQRIVEINETQRTETFYRSDGDWFPSAICFNGEDAYILEFKTKNGAAGPRIIKFNSSGERTQIFDYDSYAASEVDPTKKNWVNLFLGLSLVLLISVLFVKRFFATARKNLQTANN